MSDKPNYPKQNGNNDGRKTWYGMALGALSLVVLAGLGWWFFAPKSDTATTASSSSTNMSQTSVAEPMQVFTSILPQTYFVERIGGDRVVAQALVAPGGSPATYEPTPKQMADLSQADLFFSIGVAFEKAILPKISSTIPDLKIVETQAGIQLREMMAHSHGDEEVGHDEHATDTAMTQHGHEDENGHEHGHEHKHEDEHEHGHADMAVAHTDEHEHENDHNAEHADEHAEEHDHTGKDPHIWLSPRLVKVQATNIANALIAADPEGKAVYEENLATFHADLDALDARMKEALAPVKGKTFMVFHPAFGYLADDYGLKQEPIEIEGKEPSGQQLARMIELAKAHDVQVIFVQKQFATKSAERIAKEIGGVVVAIDPLAVNYIDNMDNIASTIKTGLSKQSDAS